MGEYAFPMGMHGDLGKGLNVDSQVSFKNRFPSSKCAVGDLCRSGRIKTPTLHESNREDREVSARMCPGALCVFFLVGSKWFKDETGPEEEQKSGREATGRDKTCLTSHLQQDDGFPLTSPEANWWHRPKSRSDFSH